MKNRTITITRAVSVLFAIGIVATAFFIQQRAPILMPHASPSKTQPVVDLDTMQLTAVIPPPTDDLVKMLNPELFDGTIVYAGGATPTDAAPALKPYLFLRKSGHKPQVYQVRTQYTVFSPQFSPNGQYVLFKAGMTGDRYDFHRLHMWNLATNIVQRNISPEIKYVVAKWSSDSRYVAYIQGGDTDGNTLGDGYLQLYVYDLQTAKTYSLAKNPVVNAFAWTNQGTMLFSALPRKDGKSALNAADPQVAETARPDIYESSPMGGNAKLVVKDGYRPAPSPDGKWIACITSSNPDSKNPVDSQFFHSSPRQAYVCLYRREDGKRYIIRPERETYSRFLWTPDSKTLIVVKETGSSTGKFEIETMNVATMKEQHLADLQAKGGDEPSAEVDSPLQILRLSQDAKTMFVQLTDTIPHPNLEFDATESTLKAINLQTGKIIDIAKTDGDISDVSPASKL